MVKLIKSFFTPKFDIINVRESDYSIIKELFIEGVKNGNYESNIIENTNTFHNMILQMTNGQHGLDEHGRSIISLSCSIKHNRTIGFITIAIDNTNKIVEIWYYSILEEFRNKKLGNKYFNILLSMLEREFPKFKLHARCKESSFGMTNILKKNDFYSSGKNKQDYIYYYKNPMIKGMK